MATTNDKDQQDYQRAMEQLAEALEITVEEADTAFRRYVKRGQQDWRSAFLVVYAKATRSDRSWMETKVQQVPTLPKQPTKAARPRQPRQQHQGSDRRRQKPE